MLEALLEKLKDGPYETGVLVHSVNVQMVQRMRIYAADAVGIVGQRQTKGVFSAADWGPMVAFPWSAVSLVRLD